MIMVGGFQRILAGGASQKISNANTTIIAAISGAVLAMGSYVLLAALDVRLVDFEELVVEPIGTIVQPTGWCRNLPIIINGKKVFISKSKSNLHIDGHVSDNNNKRHMTVGSCGSEYYPIIAIDLFNNKYELASNSTCQGNFCARGTCVSLAGVDTPYCIDPRIFCEVSNKEKCMDIDSSIRATMVEPDLLDHSCSTVDRVWAAGDKCYYKPIIVCPENKTRTSCLAGMATKNVGKKNEGGACWTTKDGQRVPEAKDGENEGFVSWAFKQSCIDPDESLYPNMRANMICCVENEVYTLEETNIVDCDGVKTKGCAVYNGSRDACTSDICKVEERSNDICKWNGSSCVVD